MGVLGCGRNSCYQSRCCNPCDAKPADATSPPKNQVSNKTNCTVRIYIATASDLGLCQPGTVSVTAVSLTTAVTLQGLRCHTRAATKSQT